VGGTGFIGGHLAEYFFAEGEISKGVFRKGSHLRIMDQCGIQCLEADIGDRHSLHEPLDAVDVLYFLASPPPGRTREEYSEFNRVGLGGMLEEAHEHGVKTFVYLSCLGVYGLRPGGPIEKGRLPRPSDDHESSKLEGEGMVRDFGKRHPELQVRVVRAARTIGSRDPAIVTPILKMVGRGRVILPQGSSARNSVTHPKDVAQALLRAANSQIDAPLQVKSFDVSLEELAESLVRASGKSVEIKRQGVLSGKSLVARDAAEAMGGGLTLEEQDLWKTVAYSPVFDLEKTVAEVSAWHNKEPWVTRDPA
jgi:nucleoside-diphosphate-sugar epimerase